MKNIPTKKITRIEIDDDSGEDVVHVFLDVPGFQNFGQRLGELERKAWEAEWDDPPDKDQFTHHLQRLRVELPEGMKWNKTSEARVDQLLMDWPEIRPRVLDATFTFYKKVQPEERRIHDNPGAPFVLPTPTSPEVVADLFRVSTIYLHDDDNTIGVAGPCTWNLEHLWGALLRKNNVVEIGGSDVAFNC
jgi:hypothetical protein